MAWKVAVNMNEVTLNRHKRTHTHRYQNMERERKSKATFLLIVLPIAPYCLHIKLHTLIYLTVFMFNLVGIWLGKKGWVAIAVTTRNNGFCNQALANAQSESGTMLSSFCFLRPIIYEQKYYNKFAEMAGFNLHKKLVHEFSYVTVFPNGCENCADPL